METRRLGSVLAAAGIVGALAWWGWTSTRERIDHTIPPGGVSDASVEREAEPASDPVAVERSASDRTSVAAEAVPAPAASDPPAPPTERFAQVDARFVDANRTPWSGVRLAAIAPKWLPTWNPGEGALSEADGRVLLRIALPSTRNSRGNPWTELTLDLVASRAGCTSVSRPATLREGQTSHLGTIVLGSGVRILGRVVDAAGNGVGQAKLGIAPAVLNGDEGQLARHGGPAFETTPGTTSASDGGFALDGVAPGKLRVWAHAERFRYAWSEPIDVLEGRDVLGISVVMTQLLPTDRIAGQVVDPEGAPVSRVELQCQERWRGGGIGTFESSDDEGRFEIVVQHDDSTYDISASDFNERFASQTVEGVKPGTLDVLIRLLVPEQLAIRVRDPDGGPIANAKFQIMSKVNKEFASTSTTPGEYSIARPGEPFILTVTAKGFRTTRLGESRAKLDPARLGSGLDVVMPPAKVLRGRVTAGGAPVAGASVHFTPDMPEADATVDGYRCRYLLNSWLHRGTTTDAGGRYELDCDVDRGFWLRAMNEGWAPADLGPIDAAQLDAVATFDIELTHGGAIEGRVLLPDGRDSEGTIVALNHGDGLPRTIRAGTNGVFRVDGLTPGKWQVLRGGKEGNPDRPHFAGRDHDIPMEWSCEVRAGETTHFDLDLTKP